MIQKHPYTKKILLCVAFCGLFAAYGLEDYWVSALPEEFAEITKHLVLIFAIFIGVHLIERVLLVKDMQELVKESLLNVLKNETPSLIETSLRATIRPEIGLLNAADTCGLKMVYQDRKSCISDVAESIQNAKNRVHVLGITFTADITLQQLCNEIDKLDKRPEGNIDFKVLLLDVLRSPATFRAFLENGEKSVGEMLRFKRSKGANYQNDPYTQIKMYTDFVCAHQVIDDAKYKDKVKYYAHSPSCWMILVDDIVFYQPYTFGRGTISFEDNRCIGALMPVFKFHDNDDNNNAFRIIDDHFNKLWLTSTIDLFHIKTRILTPLSIIYDIFNKRKALLKNVYGALYKTRDGEARRESPRQCVTEDKKSCVTLIHKKTNTRIKATLLNYSAIGLGLEISPDDLINKDDELELFSISCDNPLYVKAVEMIAENNLIVARNHKKNAHLARLGVRAVPKGLGQ
jgi:hypothetical protein